MRFGIACFVILFLGTELYHWLLGLGQLELSLPMMIVAGGGLAIASNLPRSTTQSSTETEPTAAKVSSQPTIPTQTQKTVQPPDPDRISFKIRPPFQSS